MPKTASPLTLVDLTLEPTQAYMVLDLLYETAGLYPNDATQELIEYIEDRLDDLDLPPTVEEYEGRPKSPEFEEHKRMVLTFFDDSTDPEPEYDDIDCE